MLDAGDAAVAFLSAVRGLPIPSSALIALIAVLFLGTMVLRGQRQASRYAETDPVQETPADDRQDAGQAQAEPSPAHREPDQGANMTASTSHGTAADSTQETPPRSSGGSGFTIHWGRTTVALIGVLALLAAVVTGILWLTTSLPGVLPLAATGLFLASLVTMRTMAVLRRRRHRRQRVQSAIEEAMNPLPAAPQTAPAVGGPFDALSADERGAGGPNSLQQVDEDGLPVSLGRTFSPEAAQAEPMLGGAAEPVGPWQPRAVPRPKYLEMEKAARAQPEPLEIPVPTPTGDPTRLTPQRFLDPESEHPTGDAARTAGSSIDESDAEAETHTEAGTKPAVELQPTKREDSLDLDEVLKRRRA